MKSLDELKKSGVIKKILRYLNSFFNNNQKDLHQNLKKDILKNYSFYKVTFECKLNLHKMPSFWAKSYF